MLGRGVSTAKMALKVIRICNNSEARCCCKERDKERETLVGLINMLLIQPLMNFIVTDICIFVAETQSLTTLSKLVDN